ncbi:MAG: OmpP1/FadL family transporter [Geminicoccaceae bacterium]
MNKIAGAALAPASSLLLAANAWAAGFEIREQSGFGQALSFAGAAVFPDPSGQFFNPATLVLNEGHQANANLSIIIPRAELVDAEASTITGAPITGVFGNDIGTDAAVPAVYGTAQFDRVYAGLGITAPFGLTTENVPDGITRYHGTFSQLITINVNPNLAYRVNKLLSLGAGAQIQYADADLRNAIDFGTIGAVAGVPGAIPTAQDGFARVSGDDFSAGFTLGAMLEPTESTRVGVGFRSSVTHELSGSADFTLDDAGIGAALSAATGQFVDGGIDADLTVPALLYVGVSQDLTNSLTLFGTFEWTDWSRFDDLVIEFDNPAEPDSITEENWNDSFFVSLGSAYQATEGVGLKFSVAFDQSPIPDSTRTPRVPGNNRYWISAGVDWKPFTGATLGVGYSRIFLEDGEINLTTAGVGNTFRGNLSGSYESDIDIVTLYGKVAF